MEILGWQVLVVATGIATGVGLGRVALGAFLRLAARFRLG